MAASLKNATYAIQRGLAQVGSRRNEAGWAGSCDNWKYQTEFFGGHRDYQVCIYENRGSGFSDAPAKNYQMSDMAKDALELLGQLGWDNKSVHVVGVSMGGMIAQELALLAPKTMQSLTLASTHAGGGLPPIRQIPFILTALSRIALGLESLSESVPHLLYSRHWLKEMKWPGVTNLEAIKRFHKDRVDGRPPQSITAAMKQLWGIIRHRVEEERLQGLGETLQKAGVPSMVVHGSEDALVHIRNSLHVARNLKSKLVFFEGRGHALNHEDVSGFNSLLLRHFESSSVRQHSTSNATSVIATTPQGTFTSNSSLRNMLGLGEIELEVVKKCHRSPSYR
ncbi:hypothetical protein SmJEL517_g02197 [Synchytrium microbalum]|uniref:AB hydrolase-1 domain-containing protein n=1 Tax=Synchytrium microbalum TaxID=1806994 RepID=A0A507C1C5_9FUNG|nr:uncharacterized protein SmJEL517_g02197 [Synchytrium microbalum]TPX35320.1 hypothetical protein SmJEL517_g02197 [Synchytrium microbalum]